jgi:hypothetical protein
MSRADLAGQIASLTILITHSQVPRCFGYGVPPKDWINKLAPPALVCGKAYLVNPGAHYFALKCDGTVVVFDDLHREEFFSGKMHPQNRTK